MTQTKKKVILNRLSLILVLVGIGCLVAKGFTPTYIDAQGLLIEPYFFLLPVGFGSLFTGLILGTISFIIKMTHTKK